MADCQCPKCTYHRPPPPPQYRDGGDIEAVRRMVAATQLPEDAVASLPRWVLDRILRLRE